MLAVRRCERVWWRTVRSEWRRALGVYPIAMRTPALRRPHGDRPVALRSPLKDRKATARHGNALHPREGV